MGRSWVAYIQVMDLMDRLQVAYGPVMSGSWVAYQGIMGRLQVGHGPYRQVMGSLWAGHWQVTGSLQAGYRWLMGRLQWVMGRSVVGHDLMGRSQAVGNNREFEV